MTVPPPLAPYVRSILAYDVDVGSPGRHRGIPGLDPVLELTIAEPLDVRWDGHEESCRQEWSCLSGLHTRPAEIRHGGRLRGVSLRLTFLGVRAILGLPAGELAGQLVSIDEVAPRLAHLPELLADGERPAEREVARELLAVLGRRGDLDRPRVLAPVLGELARGRPVEQVAEESGWSRRHLQDLVRRECGLAPRDFRRVARLARSRDLLARGGGAVPLRLVDVATASGYADHAHMTRDWVALGGCSPTTWLREELPYVQDVGAGTEAG